MGTPPNSDYQRGFARALALAGHAPRPDDFYSPHLKELLRDYFGSHQQHPRFAEWWGHHLGPRVGRALTEFVSGAGAESE
jgi:hypothetical protein